MNIQIIKTIFSLFFVLAVCIFLFTGNFKPKAQEATSINDIPLPTPVIEGGMSLMEALKNRRTHRFFSDEAIPDEMLSSLLWAAYGINRADGYRTAPSSLNKQEIDIYVIINDNAYLYEPKENILKHIPGKIKTYVPLCLVYVADLSKQSAEYAWVDCGFIGQNVYLFCAANHLNTVFKGSINKEQLAKSLKLKSKQKVLFSQEVGFAHKEDIINQ